MHLTNRCIVVPCVCLVIKHRYDKKKVERRTIAECVTDIDVSEVSDVISAAVRQLIISKNKSNCENNSEHIISKQHLLTCVCQSVGQSVWEKGSVCQSVGQSVWEKGSVCQSVGQSVWEKGSVCQSVGQSVWEKGSVGQSVGH